MSLWIQDFDPWDGEPGSKPRGLSGLGLAPVEAWILEAPEDVLTDLWRFIQPAPGDLTGAVQSLALAGLAAVQAPAHALELPAPAAFARDRASLVAFGEAARTVKDDVVVGLPPTSAGIQALEELTFRGAGTSIDLWGEEITIVAAEAYMRGLERRVDEARPLTGIRSIGWLRLAPLDAAADAGLPARSPLRGAIGLSAAQHSYLTVNRLFSGVRWQRLRDAGAQWQQPGFRDIDVPNEADRDTYASALALPGCVLGVAQEHVDRHRIDVGPEAEADETAAAWTLRQAAAAGIDLVAAGRQLRARALQRAAFMHRAAVARLDDLGHSIHAGMSPRHGASESAS